jgi:hypothetical protein
MVELMVIYRIAIAGLDIDALIVNPVQYKS